MTTKETSSTEKVESGMYGNSPEITEVPLDQLPKSRWERSWPTIACGAGLFSDGYIQG
jgi:hypothetical protein